MRARVRRWFSILGGGAVCLCFLCGVIACLVLDFRDTTLVGVYARSGQFHVVIDAGHGGFDGGAVSPYGTKESDINLSIALKLERELLTNGIAVTKTRSTKDSIASPLATNKKKSDMENRRKIIEKASPDLVVSIHLNSFSQAPTVHGAQTFFDRSSEIGRQYAEAIQDGLNESSFDIHRNAAVGDYFILNSTPYPAVLVECGFLSNPTDEKLLKTENYQKIIAQIIACAIINVSQYNVENAEAKG